VDDRQNCAANAEAGLVDAVSSRKGWRVWACDGVDIAAFNFCDDRARLMRRVDKALATVDASHVVGVFHHGFKGARTGSSLEYVVKEDIDVTPFARSFDFVFSGHYHGRQIIDKRNNTMYIGSPMQHVRGEDANKGFLVYDSETRTVTPVALDRPQFVSITQEELSSAKAGVERIVRGNFVDLHYERWDASFSTQLQQLGAVGVKLLPTKRQVEMKKRLNIDPSLSASKVIKRYVAYKKNSLKGVDRKALLRVGLDLYNKGSE
jgi:DNA repair exonuclease SbcCD nuclease subunit